MANLLKSITYNGNTNYTTQNSNASVYTVSANTTAIVIGFSICNLTSGVITVDVKQYDNSSAQTVNVFKNIPIASGASIEVMSGNKLILNENDALVVRSDTANSFDAVISLVEQT